MSVLVIAVLALITLGAALFAFVPAFSGSSRADKRRKALAADYQQHRRQTQEGRQRDARRRTVQDALKSQSEEMQRRKKRVPLQMQILRAGMKTKANVFIRNSIIFGVGVGIGSWVLGVPVLFAPIFGAAAGYVLPRWYLARRRRKYQDKFLTELPNAVEAIVRGVKAGMPLNDSLRVVAKDAKEPVRSEFARVLEQQSVGKSIGEAIPLLFERIPLPEVNFLVVVITVQQSAGGNLSEALTNLSKVLRNRVKMKAKVKALAAEANASAIIIGALPFMVGTLVSLVTPGYMMPLFTTSLGHLWIGIGAVMMGFGIFVMKRMIQFDI